MKIIITEEQEELLKNNIDDLIGKKVMCYYDLHRHTFSVTYKGIVMLKADYLRLYDVEFRVRKGGKQKVRDEQRKNVHAFVIGYLDDYCEFPCEDIPQPESNKVVTESITNRVVKTPSNGSASNLIESKTYENPQFMRMKDLMTKIK